MTKFRLIALFVISSFFIDSFFANVALPNSEPSCEIPKVSNGSIIVIRVDENAENSTNATVESGTEVLLFCDAGFTPSNKAKFKFVCQDEQIWSDAKELKCVATNATTSRVTQCKVPTMAYATISLYSRLGRLPANTTFVENGVYLRIVCKTKYQLAGGPGESVCLEAGGWATDIGFCQKVNLRETITFKFGKKLTAAPPTSLIVSSTISTKAVLGAKVGVVKNFTATEEEELLGFSTTTTPKLKVTKVFTEVTTSSPVLESATFINKTEDFDDLADASDIDELFAAIDANNLRIIEALFNSSDALVEVRNNQSATPLIAVAQFGFPAIAEFLLNKGAAVDAKDNAGRTALLWASMAGRADVVEILIYANANLEVRDHVVSKTPLMWATTNGHLDVVKLLAEANADLFARSETEGLPIHIAASLGFADIVDYLLLKNDTLLEARTKFFETPLMVAAACGKLNVVGRLVEKHNASLETATPYSKTALFKAVLHDQLATVKYLIRVGANYTSVCVGKRTILHLAIEQKFTRLAKYLVYIEPNLIEATTAKGEVPLYIAAETGQLELVKYLLGRGASVSKSNVIGRTPIHAAAAGGYVEVLILLINKQLGKIWFQTKPEDNGDMAIHLGVRNHHYDVVKLLISLDQQQLEAQNIHSHTPLQLATATNNARIACFLVKSGADREIRNRMGQTPLIVAAESGFLQIVQCLAEAGANITAKSSLQDSGNTALHAAAAKGSLSVINYLVANVSRELLESRDASGATPLITAVQARNFESVRALIELGANIEATNFLGIKTPLWIAASLGDLDVVEYLVSKKAKLEAVGEYGRTPLLASAAAGHLKVTRFLIENGANWKAVSGEIDGLNTALHLATAFGQFDVSRYLENAKPELVDVLNKRGHTAAQLATLLWNKVSHSASIRRQKSRNAQ